MEILKQEYVKYVIYISRVLLNKTFLIPDEEQVTIFNHTITNHYHILIRVLYFASYNISIFGSFI